MKKNKKIIIGISILLAVCLIIFLVIIFSTNKMKKELTTTDGIDTIDVSSKLESFLNIYYNEERGLDDYINDGKIYVDNKCKTTMNPVLNDNFINWEFGSECKNNKNDISMLSLKDEKIIMTFLKEEDNYIIAYKDSKISPKINIVSVSNNGKENWVLPYSISDENGNIEVTDIKKANDKYYVLGYIGDEDNNHSIVLEISLDGNFNKEYNLNVLSGTNLATYYKIISVNDKEIHLLGESSALIINGDNIDEIDMAINDISLYGYNNNKYYGVLYEEDEINYFVLFDRDGKEMTKTNITDVISDESLKEIYTINNNYVLLYTDKILILNEKGEKINLIDYNNMEFLGSTMTYVNIESTIISNNKIYVLLYPNSDYLLVQELSSTGELLGKETFNNVKTYRLFTDSDIAFYSYENNSIKLDYLLGSSFQTFISVSYQN